MLNVGDNIIVCKPWEDGERYGGKLFYTRINKINPNRGYIYVDGFGNTGFHPDTLKSGPYSYLIPLDKEILTEFYNQEIKKF